MEMIFFDLDNTLFNHSEAERKGAIAFAKAMNLFKQGDKNQFSQLWHQASEKYMNKFLAGEISFQEQRKFRLEEIIGRPLEEEEFESLFQIYLTAYQENWHLFPDTIPALNQLKPIRLGIITNGNRQQQHRKLEITGILNKFSLIIVSEDIGSSKPDPGIFIQACFQAGLPCSECMYIGDQLETDARAATIAGLRGIWLNRANNVSTPGDIEMINSLIDIPIKDT
ncbi:MAG: HAD family hydrolase [Rhodospirillales bacterium]|jgi:putative hydrolase of the HAD superfamily|nr:HAD family hydrolase [Rhodospirillales bacterium]